MREFIVSPVREEDPVPDPGFSPFADTLGSLSSVVFFVFFGASLLILWQVAILVGALFAASRRKDSGKASGPVGV